MHTANQPAHDRRKATLTPMPPLPGESRWLEKLVLLTGSSLVLAGVGWLQLLLRG